MSTTDFQQIKVDSFSHNRNQSKIAQEEAELEALLKKHVGEPEEAEADQKESSSDVAAEPVSASEGDTEQKEKPQAEAQEDDAGLSAEEANFKKRYGDLRRHQQAKEAEYKKRLEELEAQLGKNPTADQLATKEQIEAWALKNPNADKVIRTLAEEQAKAKLEDLEKRLEDVEQMRTQARKQRAEAELLSLHPDFESIRKDDAFHAWAKEQPEVMQAALYDNPDDVRGVARVLDLYKADQGIITKKKSPANKDAARSVRSRSTAQPEADDSAATLSESKVAKMSMREYEKRFTEIQESMASGKFIYDLSGR